jgi:hypothetical protein
VLLSAIYSRVCTQQHDKYFMKINEVVSQLGLYIATVKAKTASSTWTLKTAIRAEGVAQARQLLTAIYGEGSVVSLSLSESFGTKTLDSGQLRIKSMSDQKALLSKNMERERARQKLVKAQQAVQKANAANISVN